MECTLCKKGKGIELEKGGICVICGRFFCIDCISFKEIDGLIQGFCKFCQSHKGLKIPPVIFLYPFISYTLFLIFYHFIRDYVGKNLLIFFTLPFVSLLVFYLDYKFRKPFSPPLILYFILYSLSLIPWLYSVRNLIRLY